MDNNKKREINDLSNFVDDIKKSTGKNDLFEIPFMIKYQLSDEISSAYEILEENSLEGISN
ncbi:MAG: hypothetical protein PHW92_01300 [Lutibacter sp.]|nr:hypothetical protein [Lutibacter sp.]